MDANNSISINNSMLNSMAVKVIEPVKPTMAKIASQSGELQKSNLELKEIRSIVSQNKGDEVVLSVPDKALVTAIEHINKVVEGANVELHHSVHKQTNSVIVTLIDKDSQEIILEIPPQKVLDAFVERMEFNGLYLDERG